MCGILCILSSNQERTQILTECILHQVKHRGPDSMSNYTVDLAHSKLSFYGTVLHLRGQLTKQPVVDKSGNVFLWNGEVFDGLRIPDDYNDTSVVMETLNTFKDPSEFVTFFSGIHGPWSFVYYDVQRKKLWYGRDYFGRRSLVYTCGEQTFSLSSVGHKILKQDCKEVPAKKLYCLDCENVQLDNIEKDITEYTLNPVFIKKNVARHEHRCIVSAIPCDEKVNYAAERWCASCGCSGYNRTNANENCFDHKGDKLTYKEDNKKDCGDADFSETQSCCYCLYSSSSRGDEDISGCSSQCDSTICENLTSVEETQMLVKSRERFLLVLHESVRTRVFNLPRRTNEAGSNVGILFSGGIDSVVIAALAHRCVPSQESIDLINVAFAQKSKTQQNVKKKYQKPSPEKSLNFDVPDRVTGKKALHELPRDRSWNFIEVNVTVDQLREERGARISNLVYPLDSVLDDSIGCAIWFAARGVGSRYIFSESGELTLVEEDYASPVKVLLTGMGADEQLGGYARHRTKYENDGWSGLTREMNMELERISTRNLGRDDRCMSDHGREARFPFLDENVVSFLQTLPICVKCDPRLPRGEGEKILLREVALLLDLPYTSRLPKRAIQFGSKIAKLEGSKEKGNDSCERLK